MEQKLNIGTLVIVNDAVNEYNNFFIERESLGIINSIDKDVYSVFIPCGSPMGDINIIAYSSGLKLAEREDLDILFEQGNEDYKQIFTDYINENNLKTNIEL